MSLLKLHREHDGAAIAIPKAAVISIEPRPEGGEGAKVSLASGGSATVSESAAEVTALFEAN